MKGSILQPTFLPWLGYFEMISNSDIFVIFDHVQFARKSWQQRNKIKTANGIVTLTVSIEKTIRSTPINKINISYDHGNILEKYWLTIESAYKKAPYFKKYEDILKGAFTQKFSKLVDLNVQLIKIICDILEIETEIVFSSNFSSNISKINKTEDVVNLCKSVGIDELYDAKGAEDFLDLSVFKKNNVKVEFQNYIHPKYNQLWGEFVPYLSVIDLIFNHGDESLKILNTGSIHN